MNSTSFAQNTEKKLLKKQKKVERRGRDKNDNPEIIVTHIKEAVTNHKRGTIRKKSKVVVSAVLDLLLFITGLLFDKEKMLQNDVYLVAFAIIFLTVTFLTVMKYTREG